MPDGALAETLLAQILDAAMRVAQRAAPIKNANDFLATEPGREKLDAICMQLIS